MRVYRNKKGNLKYRDLKGCSGGIHINHTSDSLEELSEDIEYLYLVLEGCTNFARVHLISSFSEDEALADVAEYLSEKEGDIDPHLVGVFKVSEINNLPEN